MGSIENLGPGPCSHEGAGPVRAGVVYDRIQSGGEETVTDLQYSW